MLAVLSVISIVFIRKIVISIVVVSFWPSHTRLTLNVVNLTRRGDFWWIYTIFVKKQNNFCLIKFMQICGIRLGHLCVPYFIEYTAHTSIVHTWISQWFLANFILRIISQELIIASLFIIKAILNPLWATFQCAGNISTSFSM